MRIVLILAAAATMAGATLTSAQQPPTKTIRPDEMVWGPPPASAPPGARAITLYGDLTKEGLFAIRLRVPKGYVIPPHKHPAPEIVTVISGVVRLGMGSKVDRASARPLPVGSFYYTEPGTEHYVMADEDSVIQVNSRGPWGIDYLNPSDDPRRPRP